MTEKEESIISTVGLAFSFWTNYIKVLANRETDEREEIINVCNNMNKELKKLITLLNIEKKKQA